MNRRRAMSSRVRSRRRPLPLLAFVVAAIAAFLMPAVRPDEVDAQATLNSQATLTVLTAPVEVQRASGNRDTASSGTTVVVGDRVFTGAGGAAKLTFFQGTEVDIAPDSELMVQEMTQRVSGASTVSFGQAVGSTVAKVASLFNPASRVQVSTQSAVAVIRGTEVETTVTKEKISVFKSNTGSFDVISGGQTQRVKDGEVTVVPPPPPPAAPPTTRDQKTIGDATISLPSGNDRPPLPPVPVAEIGKLFQKVAELTARDGPPVVATPPVAVRDLVDAAQGKPVVLRPMGEAPPPPPPPVATPAPPPPTVAPLGVLPPTPPPQSSPSPPLSQSAPDALPSNSTTLATPPPSSTTTVMPLPTATPTAPVATATPACSTVISTAAPTSSETRFKGFIVDGSSTPIAGACVEAINYTGTSKVSSVSDASGTFRIIVPSPATTGAASIYALVASMDGYTQAVIPTLTAALGQTNTPFNLPLYRDDTTISGAIGSGTSSAPASGAVASLVIEVPTPTSYTGDRLRIHVAEGTASSSGQYLINTVATNTFSYVLAEQKNVSPYGYRSAGAIVPSLSVGSSPTLNIILPTLDVTSPLTCEQYGAPCSATVSGTGWDSGSVFIGAKGSDGVRRTLGSVSVSSGLFASQSLVSTDPTWPVGTYTLFASQGQGSTERYVEWGTSYVVSQGTAASCPAGGASGNPSSSQVGFAGTVTDSGGSNGVMYACVRISRVGAPQSEAPAYALADSSGAFSLVVDRPTGDYDILATKPGFTPQVAFVVHATAGQLVALANPLRLAQNNATVSGRVTSGNASTTVAFGTKVGVAIMTTLGSGVTVTSPYPIYAVTLPTATDGTYAISLVGASSGTYRIGVFQSSIDGYSMRSYDAPLGPVSGAMTRSITLPTLSASGSCPTSSQSCSVVLSGTGWLSGSVVNARASNSSNTVEFSPPITPAADGSFTSQSVSGTRPSGTGDFSINASQAGPNGEMIVVAPSGSTGTYTVSSVRVQSVAAPPTLTPVATTAPSASPTAPSTVVATPSPSTSSPSSTTSVPTTVVATVTPTVSATQTPTP